MKPLGFPFPVSVYNVVGVVKRFSSLFILFHALARTPVASRTGSGVKGAPRSGAFIEDP